MSSCSTAASACARTAAHRAATIQHAARRNALAYARTRRALSTNEVAQTMSPPPPPPRPAFAHRVRELPELKRRSPFFWVALAAGVVGWGMFVVRATNAERATSSVMRQLVFDLRQSEEIAAVLGDDLQPEPGSFIYGGYPHVQGTMSILQGKVDISFRLQGSKGGGTVYFTSIRKGRGQKFLILRFRVVCDDGTIVSLREHYEDGLHFDQPPKSTAT